MYLKRMGHCGIRNIYREIKGIIPEAEFENDNPICYNPIMDYALKERIGYPDLFTGRKADLTFFLKWIDEIKKENSQSTVILARRKMGKSALMERLYNITFEKNDRVIPFYYEIKETDMWIVDFCQDFFLTFIYQYIAFKSRKKEYLTFKGRYDFKQANEIAVQEGLGYLCDLIKNVRDLARAKNLGLLWEAVRTAPHTIAAGGGEFILQIIDEFQFINAHIYKDKFTKKQHLMSTLAGSYLGSAESKVAPLLISGSWIGWLRHDLIMQLPSRFKYYFLEDMPEDEAIEMIFNYSRHFNVPVTEETVYALSGLAEGSPFYISSIIRSIYPKKDLTTLNGLSETFAFETLNDQGNIKSTWVEYISKAFPTINDRNAKNIVIFLSKYNDREWTRAELIEKLELKMSDSELEKKLKALVKADIICQGHSNFDYRGVRDNVFDKVFRGIYEKEIENFDVASVIRGEFDEKLLQVQAQYKSLLGKYNYLKGLFAEYLILEQLRVHGVEKNELFKSYMRYLKVDFQFCVYSTVWKYNRTPAFAPGFNIDIFARAASSEDYSLIGEVKNRSTQKFSKEEVLAFEAKMEKVIQFEKLERVQGFIFSIPGFTPEAEEYCRDKGIAISDDMRWMN